MEPQAPLEPSAENIMQVPTDEPKLCMEDPTEHVAEYLMKRKFNKKTKSLIHQLNIKIRM